MSVFKCKMCGGTIEFEPGSTVGVCDHCGTKQTLPRLDGGRRENLYDRAEHFRRNNDYDKAAGIYETLLNEDRTDAEAYWMLVLCRYGVEYVEDPATHKRIPTVNRAQYTSVFDDADYRSALQYADAQQRAVYEAEAAAINEIQKGILAVSQQEEPFDVFICYKETDAQGRRTPDSVLAADLYHQLTGEGFKVFFSRITLEDKLGTAYEPYIFAALNSAKVMVVLGTRPEHFKAVWVKNEWSRYLALVRQSDGKKALIPAYRDMDPYDLPDEFAHLQAQDMSKLGFMQDLIRGIKKIVEDKKESQAPATPREEAFSVQPLLTRARLFLEDKNWDSALQYADKVLDHEPENAEAYLIRTMAQLHCQKEDQLVNCDTALAEHPDYKKAWRFSAGEKKEKLQSIAKTAEANRRAKIFRRAAEMVEEGGRENLEQAKALLKPFSGDEKAKQRLQECEEKLAVLANQERSRKKKKTVLKVSVIVLSVLLLLGGGYTAVYFTVLRPAGMYNEAVALKQKKSYAKAIAAFRELGDYKDSKEQIYQIELLRIKAQIEKGEFEEAYQKIVTLEKTNQSNEILQDLLGKWIDDTVKADDAGRFAKIEHFCELFPFTEENCKQIMAAVKKQMPQLLKKQEVHNVHDSGLKEVYYNVSVPMNFWKIMDAFPDDDTEAKALAKFFNLVSSSYYSADKVDEFFRDKETVKLLYNTFPEIRDMFEVGEFYERFLYGSWSTADGSYNITWSHNKESDNPKSTWATYNLPKPKDPADMLYWGLWDHTFVWTDKDSKLLAKVYELEFDDYNTLRVYCYENQRTYTLTR